MRHLTLLSILLLFSCSFYAQNNPFIHYTNGETINDLVVDGSTVWIATSGGLVRHDIQTGISEFINRSNSGIPMNEIFSVAAGPDSSLWLGTQIGLIHWESNTWTILNPPNPPLPYERIPMYFVRVDANNKVWMRGYGGLYSYDGQNWIYYDPATISSSGFIDNFAIRPDGKLWIFEPIWESKFYLFDGQTALEQALPENPGNPLEPLPIDDWTMDANGQIWFLSSYRIGIPNGNTWDIENAMNGMTAIGIAPDGTVWACNNTDQLYRRTAPNTWDTLSFAGVFESTNYNYDYQFAFDAQNNPWLATSPNGVYHFDGNNFSKTPTSNAAIPNNGVVKMAITGTQTIWANFDHSFLLLPGGGYNGEQLARFENGHWQGVPNDNAGTTFDRCKDLACDYLGRLWLVEESKLYRYDGQWTSFDAPPSPFYDMNCLGIRPGTEEVWIGGQGQIARLNGTQFQNFDMPAAYMSARHMAVDSAGNVWVPILDDQNHCLARFNGQQWTLFTYADVKIENDGELGIIDVTRAPDGKIWLLADHHISSFDGTNWKALDLGNDELGTFTCIAFDGPERIWIGTYEEYCFLPGMHLNLIKVENDQITLYPYDSTPLSYPNTTTLAVDGLHNLWIGTSDGGFTVFNENGVVVGTESPTLSEPGKLKAYVYPNPAKDRALITCEIPAVSDIYLEFGSMDGQLLRSQKLEKCAQGTYEWPIENKGIVSGIYWWRVRSYDAVTGGKVVFVK